MWTQSLRSISLVAALLLAATAANAQPSFTPINIDSGGDPPNSVFAADMDGDGDTDVLAALFGAVRWYENDGATSPFFTANDIFLVGAASVFAADVDGDGDTDVLSASGTDNTIRWYENDGASPPSFTARDIVTGANNPRSVFAADVDGDGDTDVLSAFIGDDSIRWYENDGATPPSFTAHDIFTSAIGALAVFAADVDGDGDTDVLSASSTDNTIRWYENNGATPPSFTAHDIFTSADDANSVLAADMDGDGDTDVLASARFVSSDVPSPIVQWYENDGATPPSFISHDILTSTAHARSAYAADLDRDGDIDVISATTELDLIEWHENDGAVPPSFTTHEVISSAGLPLSVFAADIDSDGDTDLLSGAFNSGITWYESDLDPAGACCLLSGVCFETNEFACLAAEGAYQGDDTNCAGVSCPQPIPADFDHDGDVDLADYQQFQQYFTGPK